jgi:hypothetical protein
VDLRGEKIEVHRTEVDGDADAERLAEVALDLGPHRLDRFGQREPGAHRSAGVVLVRVRVPEDGEHAVAGGAVHGAPVGVDHVLAEAVVAAQELVVHVGGRGARTSKSSRSGRRTGS